MSRPGLTPVAVRLSAVVRTWRRTMMNHRRSELPNDLHYCSRTTVEHECGGLYASGMASDTDGGARDTTVIFVDLVSFTSLTDVHGDEAGADAAEALARMAESIAVDGVRLVTAAGDGVLLIAESPVGGVACAAAIVEGVHDLGFDARGGVAHGPVVERDEDVFGSTVNLAARLAGQSRAGLSRSPASWPRQSDPPSCLCHRSERSRSVVSSNQLSCSRSTRVRTGAGGSTTRSVGCGSARPTLCLVRTASFGFCSANRAAIYASNPERYLGK